MAKKKAKKKAAPKAVKKATRKVARKVVKKAAPRAKAQKKVLKRVPKKVLKAVPKKVLKKAAPKKAAPKKAAPKKAAPKKVAPKKAAPKKVAPKKAAPKKVARVAAPKKAAPPAPARLNRERKRLAEVEAAGFTGVGTDDRMLSSARAGHDELRSELRQHTEGGPELTAGDVDAKWQDAYAVGDEAPGGDNPTPDQDRVDDIGKALGVVYEDDEELMGGEEITERDEHRWELDPASKDEDEEF